MRWYNLLYLPPQNEVNITAANTKIGLLSSMTLVTVLTVWMNDWAARRLLVDRCLIMQKCTGPRKFQLSLTLYIYHLTAKVLSLTPNWESNQPWQEGSTVLSNNAFIRILGSFAILTYVFIFAFDWSSVKIWICDLKW